MIRNLINQGDYMDKLVAVLQSKDMDRYYYTVDNAVYWCKTKEEVSAKIADYVPFYDLNGCWFSDCSIWSKNKDRTEPVAFFIFRKDLLDYLQKTRYYVDYDFEACVAKKQEKDLKNIYFTVYCENESGFDKPIEVVESFTTSMFDKLDIRECSCNEEEGKIKIEGKYKGKRAYFICCHQVLIETIKNEMDKSRKQM